MDEMDDLGNALMQEDAAPASSGARLTAKVLASRAAAAALSGPAVPAGQWVYRRCAVVATPDNAASPVTAEGWATADNTTAAAFIGGQLEVGSWAWPVTPAGGSTRRPRDRPAISYSSLGSLPARPRALVRLLARTPVRRARAWHAGHAFELIAELLQSYVMPAESAARIYRALGAIRGVTADEGARDVAGRHGAGFLLTRTGGKQEIIVDPQTYQFSGYQFFGNGPDIHAEGAWGMTILRQAFVPGPGVRPEGNPGPAKPA
jgi:hypothetical protein